MNRVTFVILVLALLSACSPETAALWREADRRNAAALQSSFGSGYGYGYSPVGGVGFGYGPSIGGI